eukprot:s5003_g9.t1
MSVLSSAGAMKARLASARPLASSTPALVDMQLRSDPCRKLDLHLWEVLAELVAFVELLVVMACPADGFITIQFHATDDPYNIVTTRSVPVRAVMQRNMNPFEGDNVKINIGSRRTILVVNVMYQHQNGAQPQKVAGGLWDPWTGQLLQKCFTNAVICDPDPGQGWV